MKKKLRKFIIDPKLIRFRFYGVVILSCLLLHGCKSNEIKNYHAKAHTETHIHISLDTITWEISSDWNEKNTENFRIGSYELMTLNGEILDLSINRISGQAGGLDANVNRWRQQVQLPALDHTDLEKTLIYLTTPTPFTIVDLISPTPINQTYRRTLAAVFTDEAYTYFIKLSGSYYAVNNKKDDFISLLNSIEIKK